MIDWEAAATGKRKLNTVDGRPARYLGAINTDFRVVVVTGLNDREFILTYRSDGLCESLPHATSCRLIQEPETIEYVRFINVYPDFLGLPCDKIDDLIPHSCIGTVKVTTTITGNKIVIHGESDG